MPRSRTASPIGSATKCFGEKDGTSFPVEYVSTPRRDESGEIIGAVMVRCARSSASWKNSTKWKVSSDLIRLGSAHETDSIPLTEYFPIFRVPGYSECLLRTGFPLGFHWARTRNIKARRGKARCASTVLLSARSDMLPELARAAFC
jgi:hypothetical protein